MKKQLHPAVIAGALLLVVALIGLALFRAAQPPPTPHPDPSRFMAHAGPSSPGATTPVGTH